MTTPRQPGVTSRSLDDLLSRLPTPGGEPPSSDWAARLERTLAQLPTSVSHYPSGPDEDAQLLRTPLPLEPEEPQPANPYRFDTAQEGDFDELRAPLKSGEHSPLREAVTARQTSGAHPAPRRRWAYWISGSVGVLAAAAAFVIYLNPGKRVEIGRATVPMLPVAQEKPSPESAVSIARAPAPEQTDSELESASPPTKRVAGSPMAQAAANPAKAPKSSALEQPVPSMEEEPEPILTPAAGPSNLVDHPSVGALNAALAATVPVAQRCLSVAAPEASARITFKADGTVQKVLVSGANL
ncbi:MAG TPA: hypothetical protein VKP30_31835, partial [Polyangiaceae bacterium]|nr:hypothetical protein [Polyangiaceae bacterium]